MSDSLPLTARAAYKTLTDHASRLRDANIAALFDSDKTRASRYTRSAAGLDLDFSRHLLDDDALDALLALAVDVGITERFAALQRGDALNNTEARPALHTLLRATHDHGQPALYATVSDTRQRMLAIAQRLHEGNHQGYTGESITDIVNIGIGGSDLGPRLVTEALTPFHSSVRCHYVANVDPSDIEQVLAPLAAQRTLFIVCSKSFRTEETLANSLTARAWMLDSGATAADLDKHFLAVTTNLEAAADFGIPADNCLPMWDWVGGRYSVWSAVGLSCAAAMGRDNFNEFLAGAAAMDQHCLEAPVEDNLPVLLSLLEVWYGNFLGASNHVVLPYDHHLRQLPDFLQQLTMESNGKGVTTDGDTLDAHSGCVLWGSAGTMGQHSFHQLLHQGTQLCPADFILPLTTHSKNVDQHQRLVANCLAQGRALMVGRSLGESEASLIARGVEAAQAKVLAPHLHMPGNRPSSTISMHSLNPRTLGALLALYEHRTFCSSQIWGINPFDQWGVELGKEIGTEILGRIRREDAPAMDASTERLLDLYAAANR